MRGPMTGSGVVRQSEPQSPPFAEITIRIAVAGRPAQMHDDNLA